MRMRPELVITGHPKDASEALGRDLENDLQMFERFPEIATENQPIVWVHAERFECVTVFLETHMKIAESKKLHPSSLR